MVLIGDNSLTFICKTWLDVEPEEVVNLGGGDKHMMDADP